MKSGLRAIGVGLTILTVSLLRAAMANGQAAPQQKPQMAEDVFKNITVLKGIPVDEFMDTMGMFSAATSLNCVSCHTEESAGSWVKFADDTPLKRTARRMVVMMNAINKDSFGGARRVTCFTCHNGAQKPRSGAKPRDPVSRPGRRSE